jgi:hypothetical protein
MDDKPEVVEYRLDRKKVFFITAEEQRESSVAGAINGASNRAINDPNTFWGFGGHFNYEFASVCCQVCPDGSGLERRERTICTAHYTDDIVGSGQRS